MAFVVVLDACVLYSAPLRDLLLRLACAGLVQARWSDEILDECFGHILANRPDLKPQQLRRTRDLMNPALPDAVVTGYQDLEPKLKLPDPDDRHVLAAAIRAGANAIVTFNLDDFPASALAPHRVLAIHPDAFVGDLLDLDPDRVLQVIVEQAAALKNPRKTVAELLTTLENGELRKSVPRIRGLLERGAEA